ncbi:MAG TPA: hypothetical protein VF664_13805, partial [Cystobacter sp.]
LSAVLVFVGAKMALVDVVKVPPALSLGVIALLLGGSIAASLLKARAQERAGPDKATLPGRRPAPAE